MSHRDAFRPRSVTKLHLPPCCSLCVTSIHSSAMPIPASCAFFPSHFMTTPSLHHLTPPPCWSTFSSALPTFLSSLLQIDLSSASLSVNPSHVFTLLMLSFFRLSPFLYHPYSHPTSHFSVTLQWQVLWELGWLCQCQAIPSNDNVYYPLCLPLPMD